MGAPRKNADKKIPRNTDAEDDDDDLETTSKRKVVDDDDDVVVGEIGVNGVVD